MVRKWCLLVPCGFLLVLLAAILLRERPIAFADLSKARVDIAAAGYHCTSDRKDGRSDFGFMVTRESTDWETVGGMLKIGSSPADWQGRVWVTVVGNRWRLQSTPDAAAVRVWGNLIAFGDQAFLDEIESTLRRTS